MLREEHPVNTTSSSYDQSSSLALGKEPEARRKPRYLRTILIYTVLVTLLYLALRNAPFIDIWNTLSQLHLWQIGLLFILNSGVIFAITARWWIIVRCGQPIHSLSSPGTLPAFDVWDQLLYTGSTGWRRTAAGL